MSSSHSCMASSTAGMDDNQAGSGPGGLHSCTAVLRVLAGGQCPLSPHLGTSGPDDLTHGLARTVVRMGSSCLCLTPGEAG